MSVKGSKEDIKEFKKRFSSKDNPLDSKKIIPYPKDFELLDKINSYSFNDKDKYVPTDEEQRELVLMTLSEKYDMSSDGFNQGGYGWCVENWGSKWGICSPILHEETDTSLDYNFQTAWSDGLLLVLEMSKVLPDLTFDLSCEEESGDFAYNMEIKGGQIIKEIDRTEECRAEINSHRGG
jgi:hypothetical protein